MKNPILLFISCLLLWGNAFAQVQLITVKPEQNADRSITLYAESIAYADYTVRLGLTINGFSSTPPRIVTVGKGRTQLTKLVPDRNNNTPAYSYQIRYFAGVAFRKKPDTTIQYLLPGTEGNMVRVTRVDAIAKTIGTKTPDNYFGTGFMFQLEDTICATRAGTVYETYDGAVEGEKNNQLFNSNRNKISIEHKDGSLSHYSLLAPIKLLVSDGDYVVPGQPLAIFNKESDKYMLLYSVNYLDEKSLIPDMPPVNNLYYKYLAPVFFVGNDVTMDLEKSYTITYSKEVIGQELSKKDKKKLGIQ